MNLETFGGESSPLRASKLPSLILCTLRAALMESDSSGTAADTGSMVHAAIAAFHQGKGVASITEFAAMLGQFPLGDVIEADRIFERYAEDPRHAAAEIVCIETPIRIEIEPKFMPGPPIVIQGTLDQIRRDSGCLWVWDVKTGNRDAMYMQHAHAVQLAAYTLGARQLFPGDTVYPGGYLRTRGYFTRGAELPSPQGVFVPAGFDDPDAILDSVRLSVCLIRAGHVTATPGVHCENCSIGLRYCLPRLREIV
jgi:hypothetical protein